MFLHDCYLLQAEFAKYGMVSLVISKGRKQVFSTSSITKGTLITVLVTNGMLTDNSGKIVLLGGDLKYMSQPQSTKPPN